MAIMIVTSKTDVTSDVVLGELEKRGKTVFRFNTEDFCGDGMASVTFEDGLFGGEIRSKCHSIKVGDIESIYFRRPLPPNSCLDDLTESEGAFIQEERKTFLNWLWKALRDHFWVSWPPSIKNAEAKGDQLRIAPMLGFDIPKTIISNNPSDIRDFYERCGGKVVVKPVHGGLIPVFNDIHTVFCGPLRDNEIKSEASLIACPCIYQEQIQKRIELRVTVVGGEVFSAEIHSQQSERTRHDWRRYDLQNTPHMIHDLPGVIAEKCLAMTRQYHLKFAAFDLILTPDGRYVFLEVNPNGQWGWIEDLTGLPITKAIVNLLIRGSA